MAKQPITRDRFRIHAETSVEDMGPLLATLTRMGLENVGFELVTEEVRFGQNKNGSSVEFTKPFLEDHPTFRPSDLVAFYSSNGRTKSAAYSAIMKLVAGGLVRRLGSRNYQRADVEALAPPDAALAKLPKLRAAGKGTGKGNSKKHEVSNRDLLLRHIRTRRKFKVSELGTLFRAHKRPPHSASSLLSKMVKERELKSLGDGVYERVVKKKASPKKKPKPKANGVGQPASPSEDAHG